MAGNPFKAPALAYSMALLPIVSPIQNIKPDDVVKSYHHEQSYYATADNNDKVYVPGWQDYDYLNITPETWQIGTFEIIEANGDKVEVEANRPKTWYSENNVNAIGDKAHFYMPEIGINGNATLLSVRPTVINTSNFALNESGLSRSVSIGNMVDRPVITTFKRNAPVVFDYQFSDGAVIGATPEHPFFSVDRNDYIAVGELQLGEQVMTAGEKVVKFIAGKLRDKGESVYNFEVWREHNYYVSGKDGGEFLLVHNLCDNAVRDWINKNFPKIGTKNIKTPGTKHAIKDAKVKQKYGKTDVCYDDLGFPDFSPFVEKFTDPITGQLKEAAFEINMSGNYSSDYNQANAALRALTGDNSMPDFPRTINGIEYTWHHHQDGKTMMLVPKAVNNPDFGGATHVGGVSLKNNGMTGDDSILPTYKESKGKYLSKCN